MQQEQTAFPAGSAAEGRVDESVKKTGRTVLENFRNDISRCVKCGSCSTVCPSFLADRRESRSPRGRMALIEAVLDGKLQASDVYRDRLATCAGCLACESQCASGVPFSRIIQAAREQAVLEAGPGIIAGIIAASLKHPLLMRSVAWLAPVALHYSGGAVRGALRDQGAGARGREEKKRRERSRNDRKARVAFFPGCAVQYFQPDIGRAVHTVLEALGCEVVVPADLACCGRPYLSLGDRGAAEALARRNTDVLSSLDVQAVVTACASCGLTFRKDYPGLLAASGGDPVPVLDIHEFLNGRTAGLALAPVRARVTWHDPCHLSRGQGLGQTARGILRGIPGIELVEMRHPDRCCGFGGIMRVSHPSHSGAIGSAKGGDIASTGASLVVTGCPGCRMQISDALGRAGSEAGVVHTVQVLEEAVRREASGAGGEEQEHAAAAPAGRRT